MKKTYLAITIFIIILIIIASLLFVDIPSPSKIISEEYKIEIQ